MRKEDSVTVSSQYTVVKLCRPMLLDNLHKISERKPSAGPFSGNDPPPLAICVLKANSLACESILEQPLKEMCIQSRAKRIIFRLPIEKKTYKRSWGKIYSEWNRRTEGGWLLQHSIIFSHTCCPVMCIDNSSWIKCQHYHLQLCCWHSSATSLKILLIFWLCKSRATPHLNIQKSILLQSN